MTDRIEMLIRIKVAVEFHAPAGEERDADLLELNAFIEEMELREKHRKLQGRAVHLKDKVFYFGCANDRVGHYMFDVFFSMYSSKKGGYYGPLPWDNVDAGLAPPGPEIEGVVVLHQKDGWTAISFWDRSVDRRGKCNSNFFWKGDHTYEEMREQFEAVYPTIVARFSFPLVFGGRYE